MAKVSYVDILPGLETQFFTGIRFDDRFIHSRLARKTTLFSRKKKSGLRARSLLPQIAEIWAALPHSVRDDWGSAAQNMGLNGWRLFVQDQTIRILNDIPGTATPNAFHQSWIGRIRIEAPATSAKIVQLHPHFYWISRKVPGKKGMYEPVLISEDLALPFTLGVNYKSELEVSGNNPSAKLYARFWHSYQGTDLYDDLVLTLALNSDWQHIEAEVAELAGYVIRYDVYFELNDVRGDLSFDNISFIHSGQNWARDPFCKDINQGFTRAFYQIPKHWAAVSLPEGASFDSVYPED